MQRARASEGGSAPASLLSAPAPVAGLAKLHLFRDRCGGMILGFGLCFVCVVVTLCVYDLGLIRRRWIIVGMFRYACNWDRNRIIVVVGIGCVIGWPNGVDDVLCVVGALIDIRLVGIFMLEIQLGSVICDLYAYLHDCVLVVCLCVCMIFRWDSYASHLMVIIGDRHV